MGVFDTIRVELRLPGYSAVTDTVFQTKSLDSQLDTYVISATGELYKEYYDNTTYMRDYLTSVNHEVTFYDEARTYVATFRYGRLVRVSLTETRL